MPSDDISTVPLITPSFQARVSVKDVNAFLEFLKLILPQHGWILSGVLYAQGEMVYPMSGYVATPVDPPIPEDLKTPACCWPVLPQAMVENLINCTGRTYVQWYDPYRKKPCVGGCSCIMIPLSNASGRITVERIAGAIDGATDWYAWIVDRQPTGQRILLTAKELLPDLTTPWNELGLLCAEPMCTGMASTTGGGYRFTSSTTPQFTLDVYHAGSTMYSSGPGVVIRLVSPAAENHPYGIIATLCHTNKYDYYVMGSASHLAIIPTGDPAPGHDWFYLGIPELSPEAAAAKTYYALYTGAMDGRMTWEEDAKGDYRRTRWHISGNTDIPWNLHGKMSHGYTWDSAGSSQRRPAISSLGLHTGKPLLTYDSGVPLLHAAILSDRRGGEQSAKVVGRLKNGCIMTDVRPWGSTMQHLGRTWYIASQQSGGGGQGRASLWLT